MMPVEFIEKYGQGASMGDGSQFERDVMRMVKVVQIDMLWMASAVASAMPTAGWPENQDYEDTFAGGATATGHRLMKMAGEL
jgi:hypothetical protein